MRQVAWQGAPGAHFVLVDPSAAVVRVKADDPAAVRIAQFPTRPATRIRGRRRGAPGSLNLRKLVALP